MLRHLNILQDLQAAGSVTMTGVGGTTYTVDKNTLILDMDNCSVGADGSLPPQELFSRIEQTVTQR